MNVLSIQSAFEKLEFKGLSGETAQILMALITVLARGATVDKAEFEFASTFNTLQTRVTKSDLLMSTVNIKELYLTYCSVPMRHSTLAESIDIVADPDRFWSK